MSKKVLYKSCAECSLDCCSFGPAPHKVVKVKTFVRNYLDHSLYGTKCEGKTAKGCKYWGTPEMPDECIDSICPHKAYKEL
jgi:hypothetical protein